jgi:3',5'-cyclic AMP phosphodiesterase CpdA
MIKRIFSRLMVSATLVMLFAWTSSAQQKSVPFKDTLIVPKQALRFIAFGDWGRNGEYRQKEVAAMLGKVAKDFKPSFIVSTGDNIYPSGVRSVQDHNWIASFEDIYTAHSLQTDWYVVLGNHDYKGNVQAEVDYTNIDRRWNMPARYYYKKIAINDDSTQVVLLVFLDTTPLIGQYYSSADHSENVRSQDTAAQRKWLETVLGDRSPSIKWRFVFGHHPLYTGGGRINSPDTKQLNDLLRPIFDKYHVDGYICGHEHSLQYMKPAGDTHYFITGAGSETTPAVLYPEFGKYAQSENGFMNFSVSKDAFSVQVISYKGDILYTSTIKARGL